MKTFIRGVLTTLLVFTFTLIPVVMFAEKTLTEELLGEYMKETLVDSVVSNLEVDIPELTDQDIENIKQNLTENEEISAIMDKYGNRIIKDLSEEEIKNIDISEDIATIVYENKEILENAVGEEISDEEINQAIEEIEKENNLNDMYQEVIMEAKESMPSETKAMIDGYNNITSNQFIIIALAISIVSIIIIACLKKPYYKWIVNVAIAGIVASLFIALIGSCIALFLNLVIDSLEATIHISSTPMLLTAGIMLAISIILIIINNILDNNAKKNIMS